MRGWTIPLTTLTILATLAGCAEPDEPTPLEDDPSIITDPTDYSYVDPEQDGSGYHIHDYWRGQDVLRVMDATQEVGSTNCSGCDINRIFRFRLDEGATIPQGAANITVDVSWQDNGNSDNGGYELWVKTASDSQPSFVSDLFPGEPVLLATDNDDNDPPHHQLSLWEFWFMGRLRADGSGSTFGGSASMVVDVEKGHPIPPWPPHPDLWRGQNEILLLEETRTIGAETMWTVDGVTATRNCSFGDCLGFHRVMENVTVPWDAVEVQATLTFHPETMPSTPHLDVFFHGADTWSLQPLDDESSDPLVMQFHIPMVPSMGDSPYAKQSLWEFMVWHTDDLPVSHFTGSYTLQATAVR